MKSAIKLLAVFLVFGFALELSAAAQRPVAALKEVTGIAKIQRTGSKQQNVAAPGGLLYNGDRLNTEKMSSVALLFIDGSMLKIMENSEVTINAQRKEDRKLDTKVDLPLGEVWAKVTRRDSKFDVETPSSVASVKGTEFTVSVDASGTSNLFVFEGLVDFQNELGKVSVKRNQKSTAIKDQPPGEPAKMTKKDKEERQAAEPEWQLDIKIPTEAKAPNQTFDIQVKALNKTSGKVDVSCSETVLVSSPSGGGLFSLDGNTWTNELETQLGSGSVTLNAKARTDKDLEILASGTNCNSSKKTMSIQRTRQQKKAESDRAKAIVLKAGYSELEDLPYQGGEVKEGTGTLDEILTKIESGELEIVGKEIVEGADGKKKVILKVKPASGGGGSKGGGGGQ